MKITQNAIHLRPFTLADAQEVTQLFNACSQALFGHDTYDLDRMINDWKTPGLNLEEVVRVLECEQGKIIGYIEVWDTTSPHVTKFVWGTIHPEHWDDGLYHNILTWAETCSRERLSLAPEGTRVTMSQGVANKDMRRKKCLESYGYQVVRHYYRMEIELEDGREVIHTPEGIEIMPIDLEAEFKTAILAMEDGFKDHWGRVDRPIDAVLQEWEHYIHHDKDFDPNLWFLAKSKDEIVGVCRCESKIVEDSEMGWVSQLCVRQPWRRQGLGKALLLTAFKALHQHGKKRVGLEVDASSPTNATRLYEKAGMQIARQSDIYEFELRPGKRLGYT